MALRLPWIRPLSQDAKRLRDEIQAYYGSEQLEKLPKKWLNAQVREIDRLKESGDALGSLNVGHRAPDFALVNDLGEGVSLRDATTTGPAVITFYRGSWCPFCNLQIRAMMRLLADFQEAPATVLAITSQTPEENHGWRTEAKVGFEVLSDPRYALGRQFGIAYRLSAEFREAFKDMGVDLESLNGPGGAELLVNPATFIVNQAGIITYKFVDQAERADPDEVLQAVKEAARQP